MSIRRALRLLLRAALWAAGIWAAFLLMALAAIVGGRGLAA